MNHQYSRFKKKNIPYAKVGRRVFINLFNAETFCSKHGHLIWIPAIEYGENTELKRKVEEIAKYQKPILREVIERLENRCAVLHEEIKRLSDSLENCHPLDRGFLEDQLNKAISKNNGTHEAREIVWDLLEELERLTGWHD